MPDWKVESLAAHHDCDAFDCGEDSLTAWFKQQAWRYEKQRLARTYVLVSVSQSSLVGGYYSVSASQVAYETLPRDQTKKVPPRFLIPSILIGKLAVHKSLQGKGFGAALLEHALQRALQSANTIGVRFVLIDAIDDRARDIYLKHGFILLPDHVNRLFIPVQVICGLGPPPLFD
jgi:GNAT superfamily N-acetyltransferase